MPTQSLLAKLPDYILFEIITYLTGCRLVSFSIANYRTFVIQKLFQADPSLCVRLRISPAFHLIVRGGVEESILSDLCLSPQQVPHHALNATYNSAKKCIFSPTSSHILHR